MQVPKETLIAVIDYISHYNNDFNRKVCKVIAEDTGITVEDFKTWGQGLKNLSEQAIIRILELTK